MSARDEIPPPPRTPSGVEPPVEVRGPRGWRASIPSAVVIALITTLGTAVSTHCTAPDPRPELDRIGDRLGKIERRLEGAEARDAQQDAKIEALRVR